MQQNIFWKGIEYQSLENCVVNNDNKGITINSVIVGKYRSQLYSVNYIIKTDKNWNVRSCEIKSTINSRVEHFIFKRDQKNNWKLNGLPQVKFKGCTEVDLPLTPFTNTLPVNRLKLKRGESQLVKVVYIDLLEGKIYPAYRTQLSV